VHLGRGKGGIASGGKFIRAAVFIYSYEKQKKYFKIGNYDYTLHTLYIFSILYYKMNNFVVGSKLMWLR
jgi:hypothetical protein